MGKLNPTKSSNTSNSITIAKPVKVKKTSTGNKNKNLTAAKKAKNDEFYTLMSTVTNECQHYIDQFRGKTILCNCDDPRWSNIFIYFYQNFDFFNLKKLISTSYASKTAKHGVTLEYTGGGIIDKDDKIHVKRLKGDGDFRSTECIDLLKESDIVVTNPPFSLFREFVDMLFKYDKKFLIIGNNNAITYKEIFSLIKSGKIWLGYTNPKEFKKPDGTIQKFGNIDWFTNLETTEKYNLPYTLTEKYDPANYSTYDNYKAINVNKLSEIPYDYDDVMGVPITIIEKVCSDGLIHLDTPMLEISDSKYQIKGIDRYVEDNPKYGHRFKINGKEIYARVLIKKVKP